MAALMSNLSDDKSAEKMTGYTRMILFVGLRQLIDDM